MKRINLSVLPLICLILGLTSCKKYLDKKSSNAIEVPTELSDLQALLDDALVMNQGLTPSFGEASADDYFLLQTTFDARSENDQNLYRWIPFDYYWSNDWSDNYLPVYNSNYCLEALEKIAITNKNNAAYSNVKGSSLFYRAYYYLQLVWTFAKAYDETTSNTDLGIVLRSGSDFNVPSVRASVEETYDQIIKDAKEAVSYLQDHPQHTYRPSKAAAYGLLARVYLSMRQYDSAYKYADLCLAIKNDLIDYKDINVASNSPFDKFNSETIFYTEMNLNTTIVSVIRAKVDTLLYSQYSDADLRKVAYFRPSDGYYRFKGSYTGGSLLFTGIATDEIYLIRAECYARNGSKENALQDLNTLLESRYDATFVPIDAADVNEALGFILLERRKELYFRGIRFADVKRLNKDGENIVLKRIISGKTYSLAPNDNKYAIRLPKDIIEQAGIQQNP